jgi:hypothetical protein
VNPVEHILIALTNAVPGREAEFNEWYNGQHLTDVLAIDGIASARRYELATAQVTGARRSEYRYLAMYRIDDSPDATIRRFEAARQQMQFSEALEQHRQVWVYTRLV